jgi:uncharacterized membrane protein
MTNPQPAPQGNRNVMIVLAYLWLLALVPLLVEKEDAEVRWHAKHGIVLMVAEIIVWIVLTILSMLLTAVFAPLGCLFSLVFLGIGLGVLILHIFAIVKGVNGQRLIIPYVSEYADKF